MHLKLGFSTNAFDLHLTVHEWVNDGLMAVFFLLVGLEIKREMLVGELSTPQRAALPAFAALGGMLAPAAICAAFVWSNPDYRPGWAIPAATDITFALAALAFAAPGVPRPVRIFFTALAVIDDLGAILIIAFFYTYALVLPMLLAAAGIFALLMALNRLRMTNLLPYLVLGVAMWFCVLESGIHATLAGIALAFAIPIRGNALPGGHVNSPLKRLEHAIQPYVAFGIVPLFALLNAGISFAGVRPDVLASLLPLGIIAGLFVGKQAGIFAFSWIAIRLRIGSLPKGTSWTTLYGISVLGGIGFTMSLFIGGLAFASPELLTQMKIGVLTGSLLSAAAGTVVLRIAARARGEARAPA